MIIKDFIQLINDVKYKYNNIHDIVLFYEDCKNIIKYIPDNTIDLFFTDPPYKLCQGGMTSKLSKKNHKGLIFNCNNKNSKNGNGGFFFNEIKFKDWLGEVYRVLKDRSHCYIMVNDRNLNELINEALKVGFKLLNILVWKKNNSNPNHWYMKNCEFIIMFRKGGAKYINNQGTKQILEIDNVKNKIHPSQKPIELIEIFIENSSKENDIVLDLFIGEGSTIRACKKLKRKCIGVDVDIKWYELASKYV